MYIIPEFKFAFLAAPRTGSKAIAQALVAERGATLIGTHHTTLIDHPEVKITSDWLVCSAVRNHWDTMISWWFKLERHKKAMTELASFLPNFCLNNPNFVKDGRLWWATVGQSNFLLRYETLQLDIDQALVSVGLPPINLPRVIDSNREGILYQACYKRPTARWVQQYFADEIRELKYKF